MKLVLSRKGFDSSAGGCPSPILPDGQMLSLPIPGRDRRTPYSVLNTRTLDVCHLVSDLTRGRVRADASVHLDPDLESSARTRESGWLPAFGAGQQRATSSRSRRRGPRRSVLVLRLVPRSGIRSREVPVPRARARSARVVRMAPRRANHALRPGSRPRLASRASPCSSRRFPVQHRLRREGCEWCGRVSNVQSSARAY